MAAKTDSDEKVKLKQLNVVALDLQNVKIDIECEVDDKICIKSQFF